MIDVAVIALAKSYRRLESVVAAVQLDLGCGATVFALSSSFPAEDIPILSERWPQVRFIDSLKDDFILKVRQHASFALIIPDSFVDCLRGVKLALQLYEAQPELTEVGGMLFDIEHGVAAVGGTIVLQDAAGGVSMAPFEQLDPNWSAFGEFAHTKVDTVGGLLLVKSENLTPSHLSGFPLVVSSLGGLRQNSSKVIFSGLGVVGRKLFSQIYPPTGEVAKLPASTHGIWTDGGITELSYLHRGRAIRDDVACSVHFHADNRIHTIDGRGYADPVPPNYYFALESTKIQLGPGFCAWESHVRGATSEIESRPDGALTYHLSFSEVRVIRVFRKILGNLPGPVFRLAQRFFGP